MIVKKKQGDRAKATSVMQAFELFCQKHLYAVPSWLAADWLNMTPQGLYQASERGWIAYFQHGRNRIYSYRDIMRYRWKSKKFDDNRPMSPYQPGAAKFDFEIREIPPAPLLTDEAIAEHHRRGKEALEQAAKELAEAHRKGLPWPRPSH